MSKRGALIAMAVVAPLGSAQAQTPDFAAANRVWSEQVALPRYLAHEETTAALADSLAAYCAGETELAAAHAAFHAVMDSWQRLQPLTLGPIMEGFGPARVQFWPDKRGIGAKQLRSALADADPALLDEDVLAEHSVALHNLQTLELLLFGDNPSAPDSYACDLAAAIARHQRTLAANLHDGWQGPDGFLAEVISADSGGSDLYYDAFEVSTAYYGALAAGLDTLIATKLEPPLGDDLAGSRPKRAENWRSARSLANIRANLKTLRELFVVPAGFADLMDQTGSSALAQGLVDQFDAAVAQIDAIEVPLRDAVGEAEARAELVELLATLARIRLMVSGPVARELGLVAGFNASDGD